MDCPVCGKAGLDMGVKRCPQCGADLECFALLDMLKEDKPMTELKNSPPISLWIKSAVAGASASILILSAYHIMMVSRVPAELPIVHDNARVTASNEKALAAVVEALTVVTSLYQNEHNADVIWNERFGQLEKKLTELTKLTEFMELTKLMEQKNQRLSLRKERSVTPDE